MSYFNEILPNAKCELDYSTDYGLLIAVVLSAQTTDKSVNKVKSSALMAYLHIFLVIRQFREQLSILYSIPF